MSETFVEVVIEEFAFLEDREFRLIVENEESVRYEGLNDVFLKVFRDPKDNYIGFRVGLKSRSQDALTTPEFIRLARVESRDDPYHQHTSPDFRTVVSWLSEIISNYGDRVLSGDETILNEAMVLRDEYTGRFTRASPEKSD